MPSLEVNNPYFIACCGRIGFVEEKRGGKQREAFPLKES